MSSSLSSTSSDTLTLLEFGFIGNVMRTTPTYLQENKAESLQPKLRNPHLRRNHEVRHSQPVNDYFVMLMTTLSMMQCMP